MKFFSHVNSFTTRPVCLPNLSTKSACRQHTQHIDTHSMVTRHWRVQHFRISSQNIHAILSGPRSGYVRPSRFVAILDACRRSTATCPASIYSERRSCGAGFSGLGHSSTWQESNHAGNILRKPPEYLPTSRQSAQL